MGLTDFLRNEKGKKKTSASNQPLSFAFPPFVTSSHQYNHSRQAPLAKSHRLYKFKNAPFASQKKSSNNKKLENKNGEKEGKQKEKNKNKNKIPSLNLGSTPSKPIKVGILGPKRSVSSTPLLYPHRANARARLTAMVDLPTPPLAEETAMTLLTERMGRFSGRPRWRRGKEGGAGGVLERGRPCGIICELDCIALKEMGSGRRGIGVKGEFCTKGFS